MNVFALDLHIKLQDFQFRQYSTCRDFCFCQNKSPSSHNNDLHQPATRLNYQFGWLQMLKIQPRVIQLLVEKMCQPDTLAYQNFP